MYGIMCRLSFPGLIRVLNLLAWLCLDSFGVCFNIPFGFRWAFQYVFRYNSRKNYNGKHRL